MPTPCAPSIKAFRRAYPSEWRSRSTLRAHRNQRRYTNPILFHNNEKVETRGDYTDLFFEAATKFIDRSLHAKKPFWAYIAPNAPHRPSHDGPEALYQKYLKKNLGSIMVDDAVFRDDLARILARIENVDANFGLLMYHLERRGIARDTIVIFLNDNGPNSRYFVGLYRGKKSEVHDGGVRSSLWVRWPARLKPGATSDLVSAHYDIMPTILDAAGVNLPRDVAVDGRSLLPLLEQEPINWPDRDLYLQSHRGNEPEPEFGDERRSAVVPG
jgi:arylsulfatase A-like enzyme